MDQNAAEIGGVARAENGLDGRHGVSLVTLLIPKPLFVIGRG
jgi:hypothetical protein